MTSTKDDDKQRHFGYIFREMAEHIVPGERIEEMERWAWDLACRYIAGRNNPDYQYAYNAFVLQLEAGEKGGMVSVLKLTKLLSGNWAGRQLALSFMKVRTASIRLIRYIIC